MRFDATRLKRCYYHRICKRAAFSFVFICRIVARASCTSELELHSHASHRALINTIHRANIYLFVLYKCVMYEIYLSSDRRKIRSSWYSYSLSLCAEPLCCSLKKIETERDREKLQQPVPPYCRWRQALGYCCCLSFKKTLHSRYQIQ